MAMRQTNPMPERRVTLAPLPISAASAKRRHLTGAVLLEIRAQVPDHQGSITGAVVVDPSQLGESQLRIAELDRHGDIRGIRDRDIIVCSISTSQAIAVAELLIRHGYNHVYYLAGGHSTRPDHHGER